MSKELITQTNGATAEDISNAIGEFLKQREEEGKKEDDSEEE